MINKKNIIRIICSSAVLLLTIGVFLGVYFYRSQLIAPNKNSKTVEIVQETDNGKIIKINAGDSVKISLSNPGDGGYQFRDPSYDKNIFIQTNYEHVDPTPAVYTPGENLVNFAIAHPSGDYGDDIWTFRSIRRGSSTFIFNIYRDFEQKNGTDDIKDFSVTVEVY